LWDGDELRRAGFHVSDYPYDRIVLNMGLIQEVRFGGLEEIKTDVLRQNGVPFADTEGMLRQRRNEMVHRRKYKPCDRKEAINYFEFNLNRLLGAEFFSGSWV
jgi:hypothetical protein